MGVMDGLSYHTREDRLVPGDLLFCYTDGITEAMAARGQMFTEARLRDVLTGPATRTAQEVVEAVTGAVRLFAAGAPQSDDITALAVRIRP
jgi:sigma-B regulation protein RsbU (phosphoserine phosphatase)